jgi:hypothetical protein
MAITDRTRKSLWAKSGNRCSICKTEFFQNKVDSEEFNIGEECHIISSKDNGPRHRPNITDYDLFDNLILLCRNHHREIDELSDTYTEELLRYIKLNHEKWVQTTINNEINSQKKSQPIFLTRIISGKELLNIISNSHGYRTDYDEIENKEDSEYIGGVLQNLVDYGDISGMVETFDSVKIGFELNKFLKDLDEKGYNLFGEKGIKQTKFSNGETDKWSIATIVIKKKDNSEILKVDLNEKDQNASA